MVGMCIICDGASQEEALAHLATLVARHGWAVQVVEDFPPQAAWCYSIGLAHGFDHPELVVVGGRIQMSGMLINQLAERVRSGERFRVGEQVRLPSGTVELGEVHPTHVEQGLIAMWPAYTQGLGAPPPRCRLLQIIPTAARCGAVPSSVLRLSDPAAEVVRSGTAVCRYPNRAERRAAGRGSRSRRAHR